MKFSMFKIFRNPFIYKYVQGYLDGYTDAEAEFLENSDYAITAYNNGYKDGCSDTKAEFVHIAENLDVAYWQGYNNAMVESKDAVVTPVSTNDDIDQMSTNQDSDGWYTNGTTYMTDQHIIDRWNELFDENPWLEGMTSDDECGIIVCCPKPEPEDWLVLDEVMTLGWLADLDTSDVLTRDLIQKIGGM